jgi:hypothetical protein
MPWIRIYGPFKNSRLIDWMIFYSSFIFIQLYKINNLIIWWINFIETAFVKYFFIDIGIILFYTAGEIWRRRLQFRKVTRSIKGSIIGIMIIGLILILYQGYHLYNPVITIVNPKIVELILVSLLLGFLVSFFHVKIRFKEIVL